MRVLSRCIFVEPTHAPLSCIPPDLVPLGGKSKCCGSQVSPVGWFLPPERATSGQPAHSDREGPRRESHCANVPCLPPPGRPVPSSPSRRSVQITPASSPAGHIPFSLPSIHHTLSASASFRGHIVPSLLSRNRPSRQDLLSLQSIVPTAAYSHSFFGLPTRKRLVDRTNSLSVSQPT